MVRCVRASPEFADLPVALYTHWGLTTDVAAGLNAGADFVFDKDLAAKPVGWQRRLTEIRDWLRRCGSPECHRRLVGAEGFGYNR